VGEMGRAPAFQMSIADGFAAIIRILVGGDGRLPVADLYALLHELTAAGHSVTGEDLALPIPSMTGHSKRFSDYVLALMATPQPPGSVLALLVHALCSMFTRMSAGLLPALT
jgi:hypothetical protein